MTTKADDPTDAFIEAACVSLEGSHASGTLDQADALLAAHPALPADSLATLLLRKADWHDDAGIKYLLEHGADPNRAETRQLRAPNPP